MMKRISLILALLALLPFPALAQETASSTEPAPEPEPIVETIEVSVNLRHKDALVWSGQVSLPKNSTVSLADNTGTMRTVVSDSALSALATADASSPDFNLSNVVYYQDFDALYVKCVEIASLGKTACDNWQYVVNSTYPPVGSDDYTLSAGDVLYFYFGTPRRVVLAAAQADKSAPVSVKAESYDYTNDTWKPLSGAAVGATQPNPDDPYSPRVVQSATTNESGVAELSISETGTYGIGLAADYYSFLEMLEILLPKAPDPAPAEAAESAPVVISSRSGGGGGRAFSQTSGQATETTAPPATTPETAASESAEPAETMITFDIPLEEFAIRYAQALYSAPAIAYSAPTPAEAKPEATQEAVAASIPVKKNDQVAAVAQVLDTAPQTTESRGWFSKLLKFFGR